MFFALTAINLELVHALRALGEKRSVPPAQLALAYLLKLSLVIIPIPGSSSEKRALESAPAPLPPLPFKVPSCAALTTGRARRHRGGQRRDDAGRL